MEVESRQAISATEVLDELESVEEKNPVQEDTLEFLRKHLAVHDADTVAEMIDELKDVNNFRDEHAIKIIETLPRSEREVNALFSKERIKLEDSEVQEVMEFARSVGKR